MSSIIKKLDNFRSSTPFFVLLSLNSLFLIYLSTKQMFSIGIFRAAFLLELFYLTYGVLSAWKFGKVVLRRANEKEFLLSSSNNLLKISDFLFSPKTQKDIFEPIVAEWQYEFFEDLKNKRFRRAKCTNIRWTYHFVMAMLQKSPIGDLIEFISKLAK